MSISADRLSRGERQRRRGSAGASGGDDLRRGPITRVEVAGASRRPAALVDAILAAVGV